MLQVIKSDGKDEILIKYNRLQSLSNNIFTEKFINLKINQKKEDLYKKDKMNS